MGRVRLRSLDTSNEGKANATKPNVVLVTQPFVELSGKPPMDNMITLIRPFTNKLVVLSGGDYCDPPDDAELIRISEKKRTSLLTKVFEQMVVHVRVLRLLVSRRGEIDILIFFMGTAYPVPLIYARASHIKCFVVLAGSGYATHLPALKENRGSRRYEEIVRLHISAAFERISYALADKLIVYGTSIPREANLHKYAEKTLVAHRHFLNFDMYRFQNNIERRDNTIGYIGRLNVEKGVLNFAGAIPKILSTQDDVQFLIAGEGPLREEIRAFVARQGLCSKVRFGSWVAHNDVPAYLASLKLLVLPSYTEGLPNIMLEAMACGTPVLANAVGSVPDVLKDKETGFLMYDNSPVTLADSIVAALAYPDLERIVTNARNLVEREFRYEKLAKIWGDIICSIDDPD